MNEGGPVIIRLISQIASRFGVTVSEKVAAQTLPIIGAAGGASINILFVSHFQGVAGAHFGIRRLERAYGQEIVRSEYERIAKLRGYRK